MTGIYGIVVNKSLVYVGKANNIDNRKSQHWVKIFNPDSNKYYLLNTALKQHCRIQFIVIEEVSDTSSLLDIEEKWIKELRPCLNSKHNCNRGSLITSQEFFDEVL